jgi:hypothetical protein
MLDFSPVICEMQGWSQGWLGIALTVAGLTLAVALMVYLRWYMGIVYVFIGALGLYYGLFRNGKWIMAHGGRAAGNPYRVTGIQNKLLYAVMCGHIKRRFQ